jgi:hypothetical protein
MTKNAGRQYELAGPLRQTNAGNICSHRNFVLRTHSATHNAASQNICYSLTRKTARIPFSNRCVHHYRKYGIDFLSLTYICVRRYRKYGIDFLRGTELHIGRYVKCDKAAKTSCFKHPIQIELPLAKSRNVCGSKEHWSTSAVYQTGFPIHSTMHVILGPRVE